MKTKLLQLIFLFLFISSTHLLAQTRNIFVEKYTALWCGWCPYGELEIDSLQKHNPGKIVPVAIHYSDRFTIPDGKMSGDSLRLFYLPSASMDRHYWPNPDDDIYLGCVYSGYFVNDIQSYAAQRLAVKPSCSVSLSNVNYNSTSTVLTVTVNANFNAVDSGDMRLNLLLTEDSVYTPYEQKNDVEMYGGTPFSGKGDPIRSWYTNHILRDMQGGPWGTAGAIPAKVVAGNSYSQTYSFKVPATYSMKHLNVIGLVQKFNLDYKQREVLNCTLSPINAFLTTNVAKPELTRSLITISPNPVTENCAINILTEKPGRATVALINALGEKVDCLFDGILPTENNSLTWAADVPNGIYFIATKLNGETITKKIIVGR